MTSRAPEQDKFTEEYRRRMRREWAKITFAGLAADGVPKQLICQWAGIHFRGFAPSLMNDEQAEKILAAPAEGPRLTDEQLDALDYLSDLRARGFSNRDMAQWLGKKDVTVSRYLRDWFIPINVAKQVLYEAPEPHRRLNDQDYFMHEFRHMLFVYNDLDLAVFRMADAFGMTPTKVASRLYGRGLRINPRRYSPAFNPFERAGAKANDDTKPSQIFEKSA